LSPAAVITTVKRCRERLQNPPKTAGDYLATLAAQSLPKTVVELTPYGGVI
jgi:hypothetical protein